MGDSVTFGELIEIIEAMSEKEQRDLLDYLKLRPFCEKRQHLRKPYLVPLDYSDYIGFL